VKYAPVILCVDDEVNGLFIRKAILQSNGYVVVTARNYQQAVTVFNSVKVDLVISDHFLTGETGCELAETLKKFNSKIPFLILSGVTTERQRQKHSPCFG
jgi:CheY-like chemotaxis protein